MKLITTLSKITNKVGAVVSVIPKPPLSLLRVGGAVAGGPIALGLAVGSVALVKGFEHRDEIKSTLGNIVNTVKSTTNKITSTVDKIDNKKIVEEDDNSMLVPLLLLGGCGLVVIFIVMKK